MKKDQPTTVLVTFNAGAIVYGMERGVIETFDVLRPEVKPHFLMSYTTLRLNLPILEEIRERQLSHSFFSDKTDWPRIGKPKSLGEAWRMVSAILRGNRDALKAAKGKDVIYIPGVSYFYLAMLAMLRQRLLRRRVVYQFHDLIQRRSLMLRLVSFFVTDFVHCSRLGFELVSNANPYLRRRRNHFLPYRTGSPRRIGEPIAPNGEFEGKINLVFFGQVSPHKGVDLLLDAFERLAAEYPTLKLHIAGGYSDGNFQNICTDFMAKEHLKGRIKYWGYVEDVEPLLRLAYAHVHPSPPSRFMDTFPLAALESMRNGVPTVCFRSGGLPEMIDDGSSGVICEHESADGLAAGVNKLLRDQSLRDLYSKRAAERYRQLYSDESVKKAWLALFS